MKRRIIIIASAAAVVLLAAATAFMMHLKSGGTDDAQDFKQRVSDMINSSNVDDIFAYINMTVGQDVISRDGSEVKINPSSIPYINDSGDVMLPVVAATGQMNIQSDFNSDNDTFIFTKDDKQVTLSIKDDVMYLDKDRLDLPFKYDKEAGEVFIPLEEAASTFGVEYVWDGQSGRIVLTNPYQYKCIIVYSVDADTTGAVDVAKDDKTTVMRFETEDDTRKNVEINKGLGYEVEPISSMVGTSLSWGTDFINAAEYSAAFVGKQTDLIVAVVDSGLDPSHKCFSGRVTEGYDFVDGDSDTMDGGGHGTHVSSTIIDVSEGFNKIKVMPVRVLNNEGSGNSYDISRGIEYAVDNGAKVINLSLGGVGETKSISDAVSYAISNDVTVVAAAGNESYDLTAIYCSPACIDGVVTVSAVDSSAAIAPFSNYGEGIVDIGAPGTQIGGAAPGGSTASLSGTSMASPHAAGAVALVRSANPSISSAEAVNRILGAADHREETKYYGSGILNLAPLANGAPAPDNGRHPTPVPDNGSRPTPVPDSGSRPTPVPDSGSRPLPTMAPGNGVRPTAVPHIGRNPNNGRLPDIDGAPGLKEPPHLPNGYFIVIRTLSADKITRNSAVLYGAFSMLSNEVEEVNIEMGTSVDEMRLIAKTDTDSGVLVCDLSSISGLRLNPGTTYYYRFNTIHDGETIRGNIKKFTTQN